MKLRHTLLSDDTEALTALMASLGWGDSAHTAAVFSASTWFSIAEVNDKVVGYARAFSDRIAVTYLVEVGVAPTYRRQGIGSALIQSCLTAFGHTAIYADVVPDAISLLARHGIKPRPTYFIACARGPAAPSE